MNLIKILVDFVPYVTDISSQVWECSLKKRNTEKNLKAVNIPFFPLIGACTLLSEQTWTMFT